MLKENPDQNKLQDDTTQQSIPEEFPQIKNVDNSKEAKAEKTVSPPVAKKGCGCRNKKASVSRSQKLQDLHEKMKKTKYL